MADEHGEHAGGAARWRGIGLRLGTHALVVPLAAVHEVRPMPALARVPGGPRWLLGVGNAYGRLLAVNDLAAFADATRGPEMAPGEQALAAARQVVVLERAGHLTGFAVDEVAGVGEYTDTAAGARADGEAEPDEADTLGESLGRLAHVVAGQARCGDVHARIVDVDTLLDAAEGASQDAAS